MKYKLLLKSQLRVCENWVYCITARTFIAITVIAYVIVVTVTAMLRSFRKSVMKVVLYRLHALCWVQGTEKMSVRKSSPWVSNPWTKASTNVAQEECEANEISIAQFNQSLYLGVFRLLLGLDRRVARYVVHFVISAQLDYSYRTRQLNKVVCFL